MKELNTKGIDAWLKKNITDRWNKSYVPKLKKPLGTNNKLDAWLKKNITDKISKKPVIQPGQITPTPRQVPDKVADGQKKDSY